MQKYDVYLHYRTKYIGPHTNTNRAHKYAFSLAIRVVFVAVDASLQNKHYKTIENYWMIIRNPQSTHSGNILI